MTKNLLSSIGFLFSVVLTMAGQSENVSLFDGKSLDGWEGSSVFFKVDDSAIVGGDLKNPVEESYYLCTERKLENFELRLSAKFESNASEVNGGISFRAKRVPDSNEVMGYQADIGYIDARTVALFSEFNPKDTMGVYPLWGSLADECRPATSRYPRPDIFPVIFLKVADKELVEQTIDAKGWNEVYIKADGPDIEIQINGVSTSKYTEKDDVPAKGCICLQAHSGEPFEVKYKNIVLTELE